MATLYLQTSVAPQSFHPLPQNPPPHPFFPNQTAIEHPYPETRQIAHTGSLYSPPPQEHQSSTNYAASSTTSSQTTMSGTHSPPSQQIFSSFSIQSLIHSNPQLLYIPQYTTQYPHLTYPNLLHNGISYLSSSSFQQLDKLTKVILTGKQLSTFPKEICNLKLLRFLDCSQNKIAQLPHEIGMLTRLTFLNVADNLIQSLPRSIGRLVNLKTLILSGNALTEWPYFLIYLRSLHSLDLSYNKMTSIPHSAYMDPVEIKNLFLNNNKISKIQNTIHLFKKLHSLQLANNRLSFIPPNMEKLGDLHSLNLSGNKFSIWSLTLQKMSNLRFLNLSQNEFKRIDLHPHIFNSSLETLILSDNYIRKISHIQTLLQLNHLDLSSNELSQVPRNIGRLRFLKTCLFTMNYLQKVPMSLFTHPALENLDLSFNFLSELPSPPQRPPKLCHLGVSCNSLISLPHFTLCHLFITTKDDAAKQEQKLVDELISKMYISKRWK